MTNINSIDSLWTSGAESYSAQGYYVFEQNNSGGYYIGPQYYYVWAETAAEATARLVSKTWYDSSYCECCGERWWSPVEIYHPHEELPNIEVIDDYCMH